MYVSSEGELAVLFARGPCAVRRPLAAAWPKNTKAPSPAAPDHLSSRPRLLPWRAGGAMSAEPTAGRGRPPPAAGAGGTATNEGSSRSRPHRAPPQRAAVDPTKCLPPSAFRLPPSVASACGYYAVPRRLRQLRMAVKLVKSIVQLKIDTVLSPRIGNVEQNTLLFYSGAYISLAQLWSSGIIHLRNQEQYSTRHYYVDVS
ncbi:hypothetical protein GUJ93_ZPchr0002g23887 [Zizania palustris]|uniref:Uncharacterized protein n=1 Tax=Zizania palustris TaxID=103762 RepID=A0A8J5S3I4_ZIZPA|nr:hypothetical protein GUJ93_ZPchr0002g23887 [Zizania palustris]